jgi:hypothetical protein
LPLWEAVERSHRQRHPGHPQERSRSRTRCCAAALDPWEKECRQKGTRRQYQEYRYGVDPIGEPYRTDQQAAGDGHRGIGIFLAHHLHIVYCSAHGM